MSTESPEIREMATMIVRDYLSGPWKKVTSSNIVLQRVSGGLSNWLYQISLPSMYISQTETTDPQTVLLRFHGQVNGESAFEHIIKESVIFTLLSERRLGPNLHGIFPGGRIEEFIDARPLATSEMKEQPISDKIAEKIGQIHSLRVPIAKKDNYMFEVMLKWLTQIDDLLESFGSTTNHILCDKFRSFDVQSEVYWLKQYLSTINSPIVFCHNDLQEGNILLPKQSVGSPNPNLVLIDFEYCSYNSRGFDLANHFLEHTICYTEKEHPYFSIDPKAYPSVELQVRFIRIYLKAFAKLEDRKPDEFLRIVSSGEHLSTDNDGSDINDEVKQVLKEVSSYRLASHLFWAIWSVLNSHSTIQFGYWEYAIARMEAFFETKKELGLANDNEEVRQLGNKRKKT